MEHYLCPLSSGAIKQRFLSQPGTMNIGLSMLLSATSIITSDVHMVTGSSLLGFYLYPKVSHLFFYSCCYCDHLRPVSVFLSADKTQSGTVEFRQFRRKLFHVSLSLILESLRPGEKKPEVFRCPDRHYRRVIWGIGPYIADYPEQVLLTCVVQGWCCR
jgi:hypothetical protein